MASVQASRDPILTKILIGINVVAFLAVANGGALYTDGLLIGGGVFRDVGFVGVDAGEWWRLVTGGFLHANLMHIGFNMFLLWLLGSELEPFLGRLRFGLLYGTSLLAGSFGVMLLAPHQPTVGASGAVFGLMGALVVLLRRLRMPAGQVLTLIAVNVGISLVIPAVSWRGHFGGLVFGAAVTAALLYLGAGSPNRRRVQAAAVTGLTLVTVALIALGAVLA